MKRWFLILAILGPFCAFAQDAPEKSITPAPAPKKKATSQPSPPQPLQTWRTKFGEIHVGSLEENRLATHEIVIEDTAGERVTIPTKDLDGESKLRWMESALFRHDLKKNYSIADNREAILKLSAVLLLISIVVGFFLYWLSAALIAGSGSLFSAVRTYAQVYLATLVIFAVAIGLVYAVLHFLAGNQIASILALALFFAAILASVAMYCKIIATHYKVSGCSGCAVMGVWGIVSAVMLGGIYLVTPWVIRQPYIEQLLSQYVLEPLGLI